VLKADTSHQIAIGTKLHWHIRMISGDQHDTTTEWHSLAGAMDGTSNDESWLEFLVSVAYVLPTMGIGAIKRCVQEMSIGVTGIEHDHEH
jgi:hypothetical protein